MLCLLERTLDPLHLEEGFTGGLWKDGGWGLTALWCSPAVSEGCWLWKSLLGPCLACSGWHQELTCALCVPPGHRAAAAPRLQAGARWFWVLVHLPERAAPEQSLCLLAAGKEGDLHCRQAQVPSCIPLKKMLAGKGGWEGCCDRSLCFVLFLLCPFQPRNDVNRAVLPRNWELWIWTIISFCSLQKVLLLVPKENKFHFLQIISDPWC